MIHVFTSKNVRRCKLVRPEIAFGLSNNSLSVSARIANIRSLTQKYTSTSGTTRNETTIPKSGESIDIGFKKYIRSFGRDIEGCSLIKSWLALNNRNIQTKLRIGIVFESEEVRKNSKIIECLLADPFAEKGKSWFYAITEHPNSSAIQFTYGANFEESVAENKICIPSPILSSIYRDSYINAESFVANDIDIITFTDGYDFATKPDNCHFYLNVIQDISSSRDYPAHIKQKIIATIIDNQEYTPFSTESTPLQIKPNFGGVSHILKIDSMLRFEGIKAFYEHDTSAASFYYDSIKNSNITQLFKLLGKYQDVDFLCALYMQRIYNHLSQHSQSEKNLNAIRESLSSIDVSRFSDLVHSELQNETMPKLKLFFKKLRWWKLYSRNDSLEYDIAEFFRDNFMNKSIENYNFTRGKIMSKLQQHEFYSYPENYQIENPLVKFKENIINKKIPEDLQPVVYGSIITALFYYQLPISILSLLGFEYFGITLESALGLFLFGLTYGFNSVSRQWEQVSDKWLKTLFDVSRSCLSKDCIEHGLLKEILEAYNKELEIIRFQNELIEHIRELYIK